MLHESHPSDAADPDATSAAAGSDLSADFKASMRQLAGAVSVITMGEGEHRTGFTATSVISLSVDPPAILASLNRSSSCWPVVKRHGTFAINVLPHTHHVLAEQFAGRGGVRGVDRYDGRLWQTLGNGTSALTDALAVIECTLEEAIERYSHAILIGRVRSVQVLHGAEPLVYWQGGYRRLDAGPLG